MAAFRIEAAVGRIEAALVGNANDDDDLESVAGKGGRFQAETSRDRGQGKGYGNYGGRRSSAWHEKNRRAELHQAGLQPRCTVQTQMCWHCKRNQPSKYCGHELCRNCCDSGVWNGYPCQYHALIAEHSNSGTAWL